MSICHPARWLPSYAQGFARFAAEAAYPNLRQGLRFCWHGPLGPTGSQALDVSGQANHGALINMDPATEWVMTEKGYALEFDGGAAPIEQVVTTTTALPTNPFTLAFWTKVPSGSSVTGCWFGQSSSSFIFYSNRVASGNVCRLLAGGQAFLGPDMRDDLWHSVVVTKDATTYTLYIDGRYVAAGAGSDPGSAVGYIGSRSGGSAYPLHGQMTTMAIYHRVLAFPEIQLLYCDPHALVRPMRRTEWSTPRVAGPYRTLIAETFHTGVTAGGPFAAAAAAGESFHTGLTAGQIDGRCG